MALPQFRVAGSVSGGAPRTQPYAVPTTPTNPWLLGGLVSLTGTNNEIDGVADDPAGGILGIALAPSAGNEDKDILVQELTPDTIISGAVTEGTYTADSDYDHAGVQYVPGTDTHGVKLAPTNDKFNIRGLDQTDDDSSGTRRVLLSVLASASQAAGGDVEAV